MKYGILAKEYCNVKLPLQVLSSGAGFYIGTLDDEGPVSRESLEYWATREAAQASLASGEWNQRDEP